MNWHVKPLDGKYYHTEVVNTETGEFINIPSFLLNGGYEISPRELELGWEPEHGFDHTETKRTYEIATVICNALNKWEG